MDLPVNISLPRQGRSDLNVRTTDATRCTDYRVASQADVSPAADRYFEHAPGLFFTWHVDADGRISVPFLAGDLNLLPAMRQKGKPASLETMLEGVHSGDADALAAKLRSTVRGPEALSMTLRVLGGQGDLELMVMPHRDVKCPGVTEWKGFMHLATPITHQSPREHVFETLLANLPVPVYYKDRQGRYIGCNNAFEEFFGYTKDDIAGKSLFDIFPRELAESHHAKDEELYRRKGVQRFEASVTDADGNQICALFNKAVFTNGQGEPAGLIGVVLDITQRKQAERNANETTKFVEGVIAAIPDVLFEVDRDGRYLNVWARNPELLAESREYLIGKTVHEVIPPDGAEAALLAIREADENGYCHGCVIRIPKLDGGIGWFEHTIAKKEGGDPSAPTFLVLSRDVTERKQAEDVVKEAQKRLLSVLQTIPDMVWLKDENGAFLLCNQEFGRLVGVSEDKIVGMTDNDLFDPELAEFFRSKDREALDAGHIIINEERVFHAESGETILLETRKVPVLGADGNVSGVLGVARDITELSASREQIKRLAFYDPLTSLPNRVLFNDRLGQMIASARREHLLAGVMLIDLDHFKAVNDTMGHSAGDELLQQVASRLSSCVREVDTVSRLGGDEFAILLPKVQRRSDLEFVAGRILEALNAGFTLDGRQVFTSCSIGIALCPDDSVVADDLVRYADAAMYLSKHSGRSTFRFYSGAMEKSANNYLTLQSELRSAFRRKELELHYQPKVLLQNGEIIGSEALLRWKHPEKGMIPPDQFIPVAEESGLIRDLGRWVLNRASQFAAELNGDGRALHKVAINLSAKEFQCQDFSKVVADILAGNGCRPEWIEIEITESLLLDDRSGAAEMLFALREMGISIAIDDFGTGYSALSYLTRFPIDTLKIDRSFIHKTDLRSLELVKAILAMARGLGQTVVAEGVETAEQAEFLKAHGCQAAQGFYFSRPLHGDDLKSFNATSQPRP